MGKRCQDSLTYTPPFSFQMFVIWRLFQKSTWQLDLQQIFGQLNQSVGMRFFISRILIGLRLHETFCAERLDCANNFLSIIFRFLSIGVFTQNFRFFFEIFFRFIQNWEIFFQTFLIKIILHSKNNLSKICFLLFFAITYFKS